MSSLKLSENFLIETLIADDVSRIKNLLKKGLNPNLVLSEDRPLLNFAIANEAQKVAKLLLLSGATLRSDGGQLLFAASESYVRKLLTCIIDIHRKDVRVIQMLYVCLMATKEKLPVRELFLFLLDNGLPTDDFIEDFFTKRLESKMTPLQIAVGNRRTIIASLLLERGADIHKKTSGLTVLMIAILFECTIPMFKLLLRYGASVNELDSNGRSTLYLALEKKCSTEIIYLLVLHGADLNFCFRNGNTMFEHVISRFDTDFAIGELAKLQFESKFICDENLKHVRFSEPLFCSTPLIFIDCLMELTKMKDHVIFNGFTLYDILKSPKRLSFLTKNKDFVNAFESLTSWDRSSFRSYVRDLERIYEEAKKRKDIILSEEKKMRAIFKNHLPDLVLTKLAYFSKEHIFSNN